MEQCQLQGKYKEADITKERVNELRRQYERQQFQEMKQRHKDERTQIEQQHMEEFGRFNQFWDQKMKQYDSEATNIEGELLDRQVQEQEQLNQALENQMPLTPKFSSEWLNLKKIEDTLGKQKK